MIKAVVYTSTGCGYCERTKAFLKERGIAYEERNVLENPAWLDDLFQAGISTTPALFLGEETIVGFRPNKMTQVLEQMQGTL